MVITDRLTFIHIPKTAGTSIETWLQNNANGTQTVDFKKYDEAINEPWERRHSKQHTYPITTPSMTVVRNPYDRQISLYKFCRDNSAHVENLSFDDFTMRPTEFVLKAFERRGLNVFESQLEYCDPMPTYVLGYETLERDFSLIQTLFDCVEPLPYLNVSDKLDIVYTEEQAETIYKRFEQDFLTFNYDKESYRGNN
tara:strand:+ start:60 stop:650 length:591 start_codon:yes stop_codon:yes gene_type:complete